MSEDGKYVITCDRDEKIKVSNYPDTYNVRAFCLGHREFVTHVDLLPHDGSLALSASGDGTVKIWNFVDGEELLSIDINCNLDDRFVEGFKETMKKDDIEVDALPVSFMSCCKVDAGTSLVGVSNYSSKHLLFYEIEGNCENLKCNFISKIEFENQPECFIFKECKLWVLFSTEYVFVEEWNLNGSNHKMIARHVLSEDVKSSTIDILTLYKRKFDNVQAYQVRKKQRLDHNR